MRRLQPLIAVDQFINTLAGGWADETISARAYRCRYTKPHWYKVMKIIDSIFFWQTNHCKASFDSEQARSQLPVAYRDIKRGIAQ